MTGALFVVTATIIAYTYVGFPLWIYLQSLLYPRRWQRADICPTVSVIMAVRNGAPLLSEKIDHLLSLDYPKGLMEIIVASDGSHDGTNKILGKVTDPRFVPIICPEHRGKASAVNAAIRCATNDILVFVDIRPRLEADALRQLVSNFADPTVGCVTGELSLRIDHHDTGTRVVGGLYWRYEQWIRKCEALTGSTVGVYGGFYAVRRELATVLPEALILDDMYQPLSVVRKGWRSVLDESARVWDVWPRTSAGEFRRKVRTLAGNYQLVRIAPWLLGPDNPLLFQLASHKLLRLLVPFLLPLLFVLNCALHTRQPFSALLLGQAMFYQVAILGLISDIPMLRKVTGPAGAFVMLNAAAVVALFKYLFARGPLLNLWTPAEGTESAGDIAVPSEGIQ